MYKELERRVLADEAARKEKEKERRISMGLPAEEGKLNARHSPSLLRSRVQSWYRADFD